MIVKHHYYTDKSVIGGLITEQLFQSSFEIKAFLSSNNNYQLKKKKKKCKHTILADALAQAQFITLALSSITPRSDGCTLTCSRLKGFLCIVGKTNYIRNWFGKVEANNGFLLMTASESRVLMHPAGY